MRIRIKICTSGDRGFTLVEILLAMTIFAMVLTSIYSCWLAILRGSKAAQETAAAVQRSRIAIKAIEDALTTVQIFAANPQHYYFVADTSGEFATLSCVSRLPDSFPGSMLYGEEKLRHVWFSVEPGEYSKNQLVLRQWPLLMPTNSTSPPYTIVLGRDVYKFKLEFYDPLKKEWIDEWKYTNQVPPLVKVSIGMGTAKNNNNYSTRDEEVVTRVVSIPSVVVPRDWQQPIGMPVPGMPGSPGSINPPPIPGRPGFPGQPGGVPPTMNDPRFRGGAIQQFPGQPGSFGAPGYITPTPQPPTLRR
ncbi:MAG: prepilin-type N-terminal cleavage/methylation domain-containing protein [Verrucomicrobiia bacterium]